MMWRPINSGVMYGSNVVVVRIPDSDMIASVIGPLWSGVSAEEERNKSFDKPDFKKMCVEESIRAHLINALSLVAL